MDQEQRAAAAGGGNPAAEAAVGGQQRRENVASSPTAFSRVSGDDDDRNAAATAARAGTLAASFAENVHVTDAVYVPAAARNQNESQTAAAAAGTAAAAAAAAAAPAAAVAPTVDRNQSNQDRTAAAAAAPAASSAAAPAASEASPDLPPPVASTWPPLSERLARKGAAVREAEASVVAAHGRIAAAIHAHGAAGEAIAKRLLEAAQTSLAKAKEAREQELARRERLRVAGLLDAKGDALPGGARGARTLTELPFDMIREVFWRLPRISVDNVALVCSDWARLPLDLRACSREIYVGFSSSSTAPGRRRGPAVSPDAVALHVKLHDRGGGVRMTREALSATLGAAPRLEDLDVRLDLDQLPMLAACLGARSASSSLRRLCLCLWCPAGASAAATNAGMEATGAALAASVPRLECFEVHLGQPWTHAARFHPAETLLLSLLSNSSSGGGGGGGGGGGRHMELRFDATFSASKLIASFRESFAIRKITCLCTHWLGVYVPKFPPRGVSRTLRELRLEVQMETPAARPRGGARGASDPTNAYCDVDGVSAQEALAPLARAVTRLVLDLRGEGAALHQVLRLPACFRALKSVRSLAVRYPRNTGGDMETPASAEAAERAARAEAAKGIDFARALRPSSPRRRAAAAPEPWDLLSSLTELDVRFLLGNYELVLPREGLPNLRRLDMRGMMPENFRSAAAAATEPRHHYLPPPPSVVPSLRWLGIGFFRASGDPVPIERRRPLVLDLSALVPAGSPQPYRHLRTLVLEKSELVVEGGDEEEEAARLVKAFPVVFPSLRMIHVHNCVMTPTAGVVLKMLPYAYAVAAAVSSVASPFIGVCRGCSGWDYDVQRSGETHLIKDSDEL